MEPIVALPRIFYKPEILEKLLESYIEFKVQIFVLVDENTLEHALPKIKPLLPDKINIIKIRSGEENKTLQTVHKVWTAMFDAHADRRSVLINLGGGVITDLGGFAASTFKRGIVFFNIPTTLLAQVDASIGGKTGVNYGKLKNQIGLINEAEHVYVSSDFLTTLNKRQLFNGFAEMLKHAFISDGKHLSELWDIAEKLKQNPKAIGVLQAVLKRSIEIKADIVKRDIQEYGTRKILNFGHTLGHAIESKFKNTDSPLLHGEAVAFGIIGELFLSHKTEGYPKKELLDYTDKIIDLYGCPKINPKDFKEYLSIMRHDKKNIGKKISFSLLNKTGNAVFNCFPKEEMIIEALYFMAQLSK